MEYRPLGRTGLQVSVLCLGTMMFGGQTEAAEAEQIIRDAAENGLNFIDTADMYCQGESERIVGRAIAGRRDDWILATKVGNAMGEGLNRRGLSRRWMLQALDDSLRRLATDYVDLWYLHREDLSTPLEETVGALSAAFSSGKIRYWGFSNFWGWQIAELVRLADQAGLPRPVAAQPLYNATNRLAEVDYLPACGHFGIGIIPYSPLARGVLTGKYTAADKPDPQSRAGRGDRRLMQTEWRRESLELAQQLKAHAEARGTTPSALALRWCLNNALVCSVLAGPRTWEQWAAYLAGVEAPYGPEDEAFFNALVPRGKASTPNYEDPNYPFAGRRALVEPAQD